jgi:acyl carrier protein
MKELDFKLRLLAPALLLDSLDLAEIMAALEKEFEVAPFDAPEPPGTWEEIVKRIAEARGGRR